ncbi:MAG: cbb3-type cytochrome c oxidase subunit I [Candidatus Magnetominusculus sp. LBB02]|nr:cbb3-type cytochrome c oxidase subunit I [Candidatus Magnetominusculus sp. LBB02]
MFETMQGKRRALAAGWLVLGIASLLTAGLLAVLLVLSRTPKIQDVFPLIDFFKVALVVHVDLSVTIWFLSFAGVLWTLNGRESFMGLGWAALSVSAVGALIIAMSPFLGASHPLMNNYVPVLDDKIFLYGVAIFFSGFTLLLLRALLSIPIGGAAKTEDAAQRYGLYVGAIIGLMAMCTLLWTYLSMPKDLTPLKYFEILFWGGGHLLQMVDTTIMLTAWVWLAGAAGLHLKLSSKTAVILFSIMLISALYAPIITVTQETGSEEYIEQFTELMEWGIGAPVIVIALLAMTSLVKTKVIEADKKHLSTALICSMSLFGAGGAIGYIINGVNVTIPAHYHGVIVGVTLSFMGLAYYLLPRFGFGEPSVKLAKIQTLVYAGGQLLHITGLAWGGGYGIQRKVTGAAQSLDTFKKQASMGLMGLGGAIAIMGGFLFLVVVFKAIRSRKTGALT